PSPPGTGPAAAAERRWPRRAGRRPERVERALSVPEGDLGAANVKRVIAGAVVIGADRERSSRLPGAGPSFASDAANPACGKKGRAEVPGWPGLEAGPVTRG